MIYPHSNDSRFIFWGMDVPFSRLVLQNLLDKGLRPSAVVLPGRNEPFLPSPINRIPADRQSSIISLKDRNLPENIYQTASEHHIPLYVVQNLNHEETKQTILDLNPLAAFVACFAKRIPGELLQLPQHGFLNLHPSLLPELRGPYPLFWTFRLERPPGITLHLMDQGLDTGDIVARKALDFPDGISGLEADRMMANEGVSLICKIFPQLEKGQLERSPQEGPGSSYSAPTAEDFTIPTSWPARRAFNFIRGTAEWNHPYLIKGSEFQITIRNAESYNHNDILTQAINKEGNHLWIQFNPGILHARK